MAASTCLRRIDLVHFLFVTVAFTILDFLPFIGIVVVVVVFREGNLTRLDAGLCVEIAMYRRTRTLKLLVFCLTFTWIVVGLPGCSGQGNVVTVDKKQQKGN